MKFSASILSAAVALGATRSTVAFSGQRSPPSPAVRNAGRPILSPLASTMEAKVETAAADVVQPPADGAPANGLNDTGRRALSPEFRAALDRSVAALSASVPDPAIEPPLVHFLEEYVAALDVAASSGARNPDGSAITGAQAATQFMSTLGLAMKYGLGAGSPGGRFVFRDPRWRALRGGEDDERYGDAELREALGDDAGLDFYAAGCDFFRSPMDLENSVVLGEGNMRRALEQIEAGENVVFLANHQSEADPQVVSCLFEKVSREVGDLAAHLTYVAGHKVTTDPLAVPFSMGRNLLCIHSKKHIDADPETKPAKSRQNMAAMNSMLAGLKEGGMAIWVAPSGGRDRRDVDTGRIPIAPFDQKTVDMFRLMGNKSKIPTHFYPMSMVSYDLCPPPDFVEAGVGEQRNVRFTPIGIAVCDEVPNVGGAEKRHLFAKKAEEECRDGYVQLLRELDMESYIPDDA